MPAVTKFGIDGGIATRDVSPPVTGVIGLATETDSAQVVYGPQTIGQASETDSAHPVTALELSQVTRMGIDGGIAPFEPNYSFKQQVLQSAQETDAAIAVINPNDVIGVIEDPDEYTEASTAFAVSAGTPTAITSVSSSRGTNIITANEQLTINVANSTGVTAVTVNGTACSLVQIITTTEINCQVPLGVGLSYFQNADVVVTNGFGNSTPFPASWEPPLGMVETDFTVDYAGLDPDSPFAGDPNFSALVIGDSCIYDQVTTPDSLGVSMDGLGEFTITGTITQVQTFDYYIYDLSDNTVSPTIEQITVYPGPVETLIGQASETDSTFAVSAIVVVTQQIGLATETDAPFAVTDGSQPLQEIAQATETDSAQPVSVGAPAQTIVIGLAAETNTPFTFTDGSIPSQQIAQALEAASALPVVDVGAVTAQISIAAESNAAQNVSFPATLDSIQAQLTALQASVNTLQGQVNELHIRMDLNESVPNTYENDAGSIENNQFVLTKSDNGDGTFTIIRTAADP